MTDITIGDFVAHNPFGRGVVLESDGTGQHQSLTVQFEALGDKRTLEIFQRAWTACGEDPEILSVGLEEFIDEVAS